MVHRRGIPKLLREDSDERGDLLVHFCVALAQDGDMPHFTTDAGSFLPVQMDRRSHSDRFGDYSVRAEEIVRVGIARAEEVEHSRRGGDEGDGREGKGEYGEEVRGVLGGCARFDGVVT